MSLRKVSFDPDREPVESSIFNAILQPDAITYRIAFNDITTWADEVDFITYSRTLQGAIDESTRVVWTGYKDTPTSIMAIRTGGSGTYVPGSTDLGAVVPTHRWVADLVDGITANVSQDGSQGLLQASGVGQPLLFVVSAGAVAPITGRTIIKFTPLS